jgi:hypothetical protein
MLFFSRRNVVRPQVNLEYTRQLLDMLATCNLDHYSMANENYM